MPKTLSKEERRIWASYIERLEKVPGLLTVIDGHILEKIVSLEADWLENDAELKKTGHLYKDPTGKIVKSPRLAIKQELTDQLRVLYREMGLTASARSNIHVHVSDTSKSFTGKILELAKAKQS